jgi:PAS domain S-box-containing protein
MSLRTLIDTLAAGLETAIVLTDGNLSEPGPTILYVNPAFERMCGYASAELVGNTPRMLQGPRTSLATRMVMLRALRQRERYKATLINYRKSGEAYLCEIEVFPIMASNGDLINIVALEREVERRPGRRPST